MIQIFGHLTSWRKLHIAQSFKYYLQKRIFSFFVPLRVCLRITTDTHLDSFLIRKVRLNKKNRIRMLFFKNRIGLRSEKQLSNHLWHLLVWSR